MYLGESKEDYQLEQFDFGLHLNRAKKLGLYEITDPEALPASTPKAAARQDMTVKAKEVAAKRMKVSTPKHTVSTVVRLETPEPLEAEEEIEEEGTEQHNLESFHNS